MEVLVPVWTATNGDSLGVAAPVQEDGGAKDSGVQAMIHPASS